MAGPRQNLTLNLTVAERTTIREGARKAGYLKPDGTPNESGWCKRLALDEADALRKE